MPSHNFNAPFVHWDYVPQHHQIKSFLLPKIQQHQQEYGKRETGNAITTFFTSVEDNAPVLGKDLIDAIIWQQFDKMVEERQFSPTIVESRIKHLWFNSYQPGDYAIAHHHTNADFCGIYLLDVPDKNNTLFHTNTSSAHYPFDMGAYHTDHIEEGNVMFWPSHLMHSASPCKTDRTIVVFNIVSGYDFAYDDADNHILDKY